MPQPLRRSAVSEPLLLVHLVTLVRLVNARLIEAWELPEERPKEVVEDRESDSVVVITACVCASTLSAKIPFIGESLC